MSLLRHKHFLRRFYRGAVLSMSATERRRESAAVARRLARLPAFHRARRVGVYLSLPHEVDTAPFLRLCRAAGKTVAAPVIDLPSKRLGFARCEAGTPLRRNVYGIREPAPDARRPVRPGDLDLLVVPGSAFTRRGERLGAGGGYFDRLLQRHPRLFTVGVAYTRQVAARLPRAPHDVPVRAVVTPKQTFLA